MKKKNVSHKNTRVLVHVKSLIIALSTLLIQCSPLVRCSAPEAISPSTAALLLHHPPEVLASSPSSVRLVKIPPCLGIKFFGSMSLLFHVSFFFAFLGLFNLFSAVAQELQGFLRLREAQAFKNTKNTKQIAVFPQ